MPIHRHIVLALCAASTLIFSASASAQSAYPDKPVKVIVALPAGGSVDMIARTLGQKLNASLGQAFVVDNRAGGSGQIGMPAVSKAPPDGYTLAVSPASFLTTNKSIFKTLPPAGRATMTLTGLSGYALCADAEAEKIKLEAAHSAKTKWRLEGMGYFLGWSCIVLSAS